MIDKSIIERIDAELCSADMEYLDLIDSIYDAEVREVTA